LFGIDHVSVQVLDLSLDARRAAISTPGGSRIAVLEQDRDRPLPKSAAQMTTESIDRSHSPND